MEKKEGQEMKEKTRKLLEMFVTEGLVDGQGVPQELPKMNPQSQQNIGTPQQTQTKPQVPQNPAPSEPEPKTNATSPGSSLPKEKDGDEGEVKEGRDKYIQELEAANYGLHLAEYHFAKMGEMKSLSEVEDIELDKIGAAHKIITDTRTSLTEMLSKLKK